MHSGTSDLIRLIPALDQWRGLDVRCRNQADQNGISGRNHHDDFTRRPAFRQDAWPSRRFFLAKIGFIKFWSILVLPGRPPAQIRVTAVKFQKKEYRDGRSRVIWNCQRMSGLRSRVIHQFTLCL